MIQKTLAARVDTSKIASALQPQRETIQDREREARVAAVYQKRFGVQCMHFRPQYPLDVAVFYHGTMVAVAEIKTRPYSAGARTHELVKLDKFRHAMPFLILGFPIHFIVGFADGRHFYYPFHLRDIRRRPTAPIRVVWGGTNKRGENDYEPLCQIPFSLFRSIDTQENS